MFIRRCLLVGGLFFSSLFVVSDAADPDWYLKRETWQDTWHHSREAYLAQSGLDATSGLPKQFVSEIVRGGDPARKIRIPVAGAHELYLIVIGAPDVVQGAASWADARRSRSLRRPSCGSRWRRPANWSSRRCRALSIRSPNGQRTSSANCRRMSARSMV